MKSANQTNAPRTAACRMCARYQRLPGARRVSSKRASGHAMYAVAARAYSSVLVSGDEDPLCSQVTRGPVCIVQFAYFDTMAARAMHEATVAKIYPDVGRSIRIRLEEDEVP